MLYLKSQRQIYIYIKYTF